jgi:hypothetical protein
MIFMKGDKGYESDVWEESQAMNCCLRTLKIVPVEHGTRLRFSKDRYTLAAIQATA